MTDWYSWWWMRCDRILSSSGRRCDFCGGTLEPITLCLTLSPIKPFDSLLAKGKATPYIALATPPTVTMPRLKALTTGSTPNFLDVMLNLDASSSSLSKQDNWLYQLKTHRNMSIGFHGDDTWLKLFPGYFDERSEGTTSFFVAVRNRSWCFGNDENRTPWK